VTGAKVDVRLSDAYIPLVSISTESGEIKLDHLRYDEANIRSVRDDITLEDDRSTELRYRSAADFLCLAAPLIEEMPTDATPCVMEHKYTSERVYNTASISAHEAYDSTADGYINRAEFTAGLRKLGLDFAHDSLDLTSSQAALLLDHVFSESDPDSAQMALPYQLFQRQLEQVAPFFTTLYDTTTKRDCYENCLTIGTRTDHSTAHEDCQRECTWECNVGGFNITESTYGLCDLTQARFPDHFTSGRARQRTGLPAHRPASARQRPPPMRWRVTDPLTACRAACRHVAPRTRPSTCLVLSTTRCMTTTLPTAWSPTRCVALGCRGELRAALASTQGAAWRLLETATCTGVPSGSAQDLQQLHLRDRALR